MTRRAWWLIVAVTVAGAAWALDPPRPAPTPPASTETHGEQPVPATATPVVPQPVTPPAEEEAPPPAAPEIRRTGPTPQRFDPTEEVRADFPVSFPSDI